jgi:hypothetical protein
VCWCLVLTAMVITPQVLSLSAASRAIELSFFAIPLSSWGMTCVRASVALMILRFRSASLYWRIFLHSLTVIQIAFSVAYTAFWVTVCHPLSDWWDLANPGGNCADTETVRRVTLTGASLNIVMDVLLSVAPVTFLWNLHRPPAERILVCVLMGMGSFASVASIIKLAALLKWSRQPEDDDMWAMAENMNTWAVTETSFVVMAACLPFLKPALHRVLQSVGARMSVSSTKSLTWYRGGQAMFATREAELGEGGQSDGSGQVSTDGGAKESEL